MKTIEEFLKQMPEPYKTQALSNLILDMGYEEVRNLATAIDNAFDWDNSPEGHDYWEEIYEKASWGVLV